MVATPTPIRGTIRILCALFYEDKVNHVCWLENEEKMRIPRLFGRVRPSSIVTLLFLALVGFVYLIVSQSSISKLVRMLDAHVGASYSIERARAVDAIAITSS